MGPELEQALGASITTRRALAGGDINEAWAITLSDGREVFVKSKRAAPEGMFAREAEGLAWLRTGAIRIPEVLAVGERFLALERIVPGRPRGDHDEQLGRGLAALHRATPTEGFGFPRDNFIADLPQDNRSEADWPSFYAERRLRPMLRRAVGAGRASTAMQRGFERLFTRMVALVGPPEPAARLHGDLWGGNAMVDEQGAPVLIDPAVYGGHREVDLAMMRLFGGFGARVFAAYEEAWPLAPGVEERVGLYQLYPLLVHVVLFGGGYAGSVERHLRQLI